MRTLRPRAPRASRRSWPRPSEEGFTLIEMVVAIAILALVMVPFAETFVTSTFLSGDAQLKEVAVTLADTALDGTRAVSPPSALLSGTSATSAPTAVVLSATSSPVVQSTRTTTLDRRTFTTTVYAGRCYLQGDGTCSTTSSAEPMIRVIAEVTWAAPSGCSGGTCSYVASSLISDAADPTLETNPSSVPAPPFDVSATGGAAGSGWTVTVSWSAPSSTLPITGYTVTASPGSEGCTTTGALSCTLQFSSAGTYSVTVTATNSAGTSAPSTAVDYQAVSSGGDGGGGGYGGGGYGGGGYGGGGYGGYGGGY